MSKNEYPTKEESRRILREAEPSAYDGHTEFASLDVEGRIRWASRSAQVVLWARHQRQPDAG